MSTIRETITISTSNKMTENSIMDAGVFPYEVLVNIFKYLSLSDRKNVRLTCNRWNDACHHPWIVKQEKFVLHPGVTRGDTKRTGVCITNCQILRSDFEFYGLVGREIPSIVWSECGDRITSVFLNECAVDKETVKNILSSCANLVSLRIVSVNWIHVSQDYDYRGLDLSTTLEDLIRLGVKRENLITLELLTPISIPDEDLRQIFQICPKIQTFRHGCWSSDNLRCGCENIQFPFNYVHSDYTHYITKELLLPIPIKNFTFNWWMDPGWLTSFKPDLGAKFKELELSIWSNEELIPTGDVLSKFLSNQTELEKLSLHVLDFIYDPDTDFFSTLVYRILRLRRCKLKTLRLHTYNYRIDFQINEFMEFLHLISDLESLEVNLSWVNHSAQIKLLPAPSQKFINLNTLRLKCLDELVILHILKRCSCLSTLYLDTASDPILQTIFEHHTNLKELDFHCGFENCTDVGFTGEVKRPNTDGSLYEQSTRYSLARLQNLERFVLESRNEHDGRRRLKDGIFSAILAEFDFPRLKHFKFDCVLSTQEERRLLETVSTRAPCLENLAIDKIKLTLFIKCCERMKHLKCVKFISCSSTDLYEKLFRLCPSLINVFIHDAESGREEGTFSWDKTLFYDRTSQTFTWLQCE